MRIVLLFLLFCSTVLSAQEHKTKPTDEEKIVVLPTGEIHNGDFFAWGSSVEISGTVNGDVYIFAEQIIIDGVVNGDALCAGGSIDISGEVAHNCRLLGGQILIGGDVGNNVTALAGNLQLLNSAEIKGNLVAVAGNTDLAAKIGIDATIFASNLRVSSHIVNNLFGSVGEMRLTSRALVGGNLDYRSNSPIWIEEGALIRGTINTSSFICARTDQRYLVSKPTRRL